MREYDVEDPVVEETRVHGCAYTDRMGYDIHRIFEDLRRHQSENADRYVNQTTVIRDAAKPQSA